MVVGALAQKELRRWREVVIGVAEMRAMKGSNRIRTSGRVGARMVSVVRCLGRVQDREAESDNVMTSLVR